jgi:hypothetical protein
MLANTRFNLFTGRRCAAFAPTGAVKTLHTAITPNAGNHT